ncbi:MAG: hypothetical protein QME12_07725 [Nanoarchaeota archaeon]|nr:hypothetical protein [Nanoarchaeota archaeon]
MIKSISTSISMEISIIEYIKEWIKEHPGTTFSGFANYLIEKGIEKHKEEEDGRKDN